MKKISCLVLVSMFTMSLFAQQPATQDKAAPASTPAAKQNSVVVSEKTKSDRKNQYWCTGCEYSSAKAGVCPHHKTALVMEGNYFCVGDEAHATVKQGKCKDGSAMTRMDEAYSASVKSKQTKQMGEK